MTSLNYAAFEFCLVVLFKYWPTLLWSRTVRARAHNKNDITSMAFKSSEARAQKRNKTKSVIIFKSRGHTGIIISFMGLFCLVVNSNLLLSWGRKNICKSMLVWMVFNSIVISDTPSVHSTLIIIIYVTA